MVVLIGVIVAIMCVFLLRMYTLAAVSPDERAVADADSMTYQTTVEGARGCILDRNGNVLVSNRATYNIVIINYVLANTGAANENILKLLQMCEQLGIECQSHFPVTNTRPYEYDMQSLSTTWQTYFRQFLNNRDYDLDISASTLMRNLREAYKIPNDWSQEDVYKVISVRYELELRSVATNLENYMLAEDVDAESLAAVAELGIPGVIVQSGTVREYKTAYAAHLLGTLGAMDADEWEVYRENDDYNMNAMIGKSGIEKAFEEYLHGVSGTKITTVSTTGDVLSEYYTKMPEPGNNVETTIDISLQATAEQALEKVILDLRENGVGKNKEGKDAEGGAVVVQQVKTGEVLACASYPTFDLSTYRENFKELSEDEYSPLYNRALLAAYPPGSIYKMVTAIAASDYGHYSPYHIITDQGLYTYYDSFQPKCYVWSRATGATHGPIDMRQAIAHSCNYYFYEVGRVTYDTAQKEVGYNPFDVIAKALGLGEPTGVELDEETGMRANAETKKEMYVNEDSGWYGADVLQAVIGQSLNRFTPMQMCSYVQALANQGTRYSATFLSRVISWDYQDLILEHAPEIASQLEMSDDAKLCISEGMYLTTQEGTAEEYFKYYPVKVACKTGTAQWQGTTSSGAFGGSDHASFVLYAPADDPEIAIAVYVEKGSKGGNLSNVCIPILDAYFSSATHYETVMTENTAD